MQVTRFKAVKKDSTCLFSGCISDTTTFNHITDLLQGSEVIDFKDIGLATWLGLKNLLGFLAGLEKKYTFTSVPQNVFRQLTLILEQYQGIEFDVVEIKAYTEKPAGQGEPGGGAASANFSVSTTGLLQVLLDAGPFGCVGSANERPIHSLAHLCRPLLACEMDFSEKLNNPWAKTNGEEALFWHDYLSFLENVVQVCIDAIMSLRATLSIKLENLQTRIRNAEKGAAVFELNASCGGAAGFDFSESIDASTQELLQQLQRAQGECENLLLDLQRYFHSDGGERAEFYTHTAKIYTLVKGGLSDAIKSIEASGTALSTLICQLFCAQPLVQGFSALHPSQVNDEKLTAVREAFLIMDVMTEGDFEATRDEIVTEIQAIENDLMSSLVDLQCFDSTRQILEHRVRESNILEAMLPSCQANELPWEVVRDEVLRTGGEKLVTDQEKRCFAFYFPYFNKATDGQMDSGEVNFF